MNRVSTILAACAALAVTHAAFALTPIRTQDAGRFVALPNGTPRGVNATNSFGSYLMDTNRIALTPTTLAALSALCEGVYERRYFMSEGQSNDWSEDFGHAASDKTRISVADHDELVWGDDLAPWAYMDGDQRVWNFDSRALFWATNLTYAAKCVTEDAASGWSRVDDCDSHFTLARSNSVWRWQTDDFEISSRGLGAELPIFARTETPNLAAYRGTMLPLSAAENDDIIYTEYEEVTPRNLPRELWQYLYYGEDNIRHGITNTLASVERLTNTVIDICLDRFGPLVGADGSRTNITAIIEDGEESAILHIGHALDRQQLGALGQMLALTDRTLGIYECSQPDATNAWRRTHETHHASRTASKAVKVILTSNPHPDGGYRCALAETVIGSELTWHPKDDFAEVTTTYSSVPDKHALFRSSATISSCSAGDATPGASTTLPGTISYINKPFLLGLCSKFDELDGQYQISIGIEHAKYGTGYNNYIVEGVITKEGVNKQVDEVFTIPFGVEYDMILDLGCVASREITTGGISDGFSVTLDPADRQTHPGTEGFSTGRAISPMAYPVLSYATIEGTNADALAYITTGATNEYGSVFASSYRAAQGVFFDSRAELVDEVKRQNGDLHRWLTNDINRIVATADFDWNNMRQTAYGCVCSGGVWKANQSLYALGGTFGVSGGEIVATNFVNGSGQAVRIPAIVCYASWTPDVYNATNGFTNLPDAPAFAADGKIALPWRVDWNWKASGAGAGE